MQSKSESASRIEANPYNISPSAACAEPWWRSPNYNSISHTVISMEQSKDGQSQSDGLDEEADDAIRESQIPASRHSDGDYGQDHQNFQHRTSAMPPRSHESLTQHPQLELVGHSIACASNPYPDPYYGGMMASYGPQPLVPPHLLVMHHPRMPLPLEMAQEPVYVNAKQYNGILRRRQSRAKAELEKKLIKVRKPYLHESRHQHAVRRARGCGGRFAKKSDAEAGSAISLHTASSSGSEPLRCKTAEIRNGHEEAKGPEVHENYDRYQNHSSFQASTYARTAKGGEADSSGQQWGSISSNKASQRALAI